MNTVKSLKESYNNFINENNKIYRFKSKETLNNINRVKNEFKDIKVERCQEYANYCYFIASK